MAQLLGPAQVGGVLNGADLRHCNLRDARLGGAELNRAKLQGADLLDALGLTQEQINTADLDEKTRLPGYLIEED